MQSPTLCYALYTSYRRFHTDVQSMLAGAFFAPMREKLPPVFTKMELRIHLPDGMRCSLMGEVIQEVPGHGVTIGFDRRDPSLDAIRQAVQRESFQEAVMQETAPGAEPIIGFTDPVATLRTRLDPRASGELRTRLTAMMTAGPDRRR